jgi:hypothetical protein
VPLLQWVPARSLLTSMQLPQNSNKRKSNQITKPSKTVEREATRHKRQLHRKNTKRDNDLALLVDVRSLGQKNRSGRLLSTSLSLSLADTSRVDHVDLYGLDRNGIGPSLS